MPVFDFHCHPALKSSLAADSLGLTPWNHIKASYSIGNCDLSINEMFNGSLDSQSNLVQMLQGEVNLAGVIIYPLESELAKAVMSKKMVSKGKINLLDPVKLGNMRDGGSYYQWTKQTMNHLLQHSQHPERNGQSFRFINSMREYNREDKTTVHGVLIFEGLHSFFHDPFSPHAEADFHNNFEDFKLQFKTRILAVNLPHMQRVPFSGHAYGMQFLSPKMFVPESKGLPEAGRRLVEKMHQESILIDIKHMSYHARTDLRSLRNRKGWEDLPLLCTHAGVTGIPESARYKYLYSRPVQKHGGWSIRHVRPSGYIPGTAFNVSSINLYDEEILRIIQSGGMIGISLDERIIGFPAVVPDAGSGRYTYEEEYIAKAEEKIFFQGAPDIARISPVTDFSHILDGDEAENLQQLPAHYHLYYFLNQVLHILQIAELAGIPSSKAMQHICIGSDLDGLINALDCCRDATELKGFKSALVKTLKNEPELLDNYQINRSRLDVDALFEYLFFESAFNFLNKHFN